MVDYIRRSMMARLLVIGAVAMVTGGAQYSCSSGDPSLLPPRDIDSGDGPTFTTTLTLEDSAGVEKSSFAQGELIVLKLTVRNRTSQPVELDFATGQQYDFFAFRSGANSTSWRWSATALFTQATSQLSFAAGESKLFTVTWAPDLPRGAYEARGALVFDGLSTNPLAPHELGSTLKVFNIE
jgi:hypothetical protein